jgi:arylsulfatase A
MLGPVRGFSADHAPAVGGAGAAQPNIIFVLGDDLGFEMLGCYGSDRFKTPNVDSLAQGGTRYWYCHTSPVCGPSRCQFVTGQYPFRTSHVENNPHVQTIDPKGLPSVARVLKKAGYATALCGKWHMSRKPQDWGFDEADKTPGQRYWAGTGKDGNPLYKPDLMQDWAAKFIQRNADRPFFLWYSLHVPHADLSYTPDSMPETVAQFKKSRDLDPRAKRELDHTIMADNLAYMDKVVGQLVAELDRLKLRERTLLIFAGDNGCGWQSTIGQRRVVGAKRHLQDGGSTVPLIVNWPGTTPAGRVCNDLVGFEDFLPTFAELAGAELPKDAVLDGVSFAPQLRGEKGNPREMIFTQYRDHWYVRDHRRKLYDDGKLMDTSDYPFTEKPLPADAEPEVRRRLQGVMDKLGVAEIMRAHPEWHEFKN